MRAVEVNGIKVVQQAAGLLHRQCHRAGFSAFLRDPPGQWAGQGRQQQADRRDPPGGTFLESVHARVPSAVVHGPFLANSIASP